MDAITIRGNYVRYMQSLTMDEIQVEDVSENLKIKMSSGNNQLVERILSQGTRETIDLVFRLPKGIALTYKRMRTITMGI